jgi:uncharacterized protein DUF6883
MKLPPDSVISDRKLKEYLLSPRVEDDKSGFLAIAGYTPSHWNELEADLRGLIRANDADLTRSTVYGDMYEVKGSLVGPNGKTLQVITVWNRLKATGETRFVTLVPDKEAEK